MGDDDTTVTLVLCLPLSVYSSNYRSTGLSRSELAMMIAEIPVSLYISVGKFERFS